MRKVSVMMLSYNKSCFTKLALEKMIQNLDYPVETFVLVDNGSTDDTLPWVRNYMEQYFHEDNKDCKIARWQIIENGKNLGIACAQNQGAKACPEDSDVVMISNDVFVGPNWLSPLVNCVESASKVCKIGWVSPYMSPEHLFDSVVNEEFRQNYFDHWYRRHIINANDVDALRFTIDQIYDGDFNQFSREFVERNKGKLWDEAVSMMFYWTRECINEVGYFDEQFSEFFGRGGWGSEDNDLQIRMNNLDYYRLTCFDSFVHHAVCATTRKIVLDDPEMAFGDIQTGSKMLRKWLVNPQSPERYCPVETAVPKRNQMQYLLRKLNTTFGDITKLDLGLTPAELKLINDKEYEFQGVQHG